MYGAYQSRKFLFSAPLLIVFLFFVNLLSSPGEWWHSGRARHRARLGDPPVQGIASRGAAGGLAALAAYLSRR